MVLSLNVSNIPKKEWEKYLTDFCNEAKSRKSEGEKGKVSIKRTIFSHQIEFINSIPGLILRDKKRIHPGYYFCSFDVA